MTISFLKNKKYHSLTLILAVKFIRSVWTVDRAITLLRAGYKVSITAHKLLLHRRLVTSVLVTVVRTVSDSITFPEPVHTRPVLAGELEDGTATVDLVRHVPAVVHVVAVPRGWYTLASGTLELVLVTGTRQFIRPVLTVVSLVTHVVLGDAASVLTRELVRVTRTRVLILHVVTVTDTVTSSVTGDTLTIATVKLVIGAGNTRGPVTITATQTSIRRL